MTALWSISAYCASLACGAAGTGITASGVRPVAHYTVACPPELPHGTRLRIETVGVRVCEDRGRAIKGRKLDLYLDTIEQAQAWGRRKRRVQVIWQPGQLARLPWGRPGCPGEGR